jgi:putative transposase
MSGVPPQPRFPAVVQAVVITYICYNICSKMKAFRYKIRRPSKAVVQRFEQTLSLCRELYNAALQERREAWKLNRIGISYVEQANQLREIKAIRDDFETVHSQVLQDVLKRLDKTFKAFFSRVKKGEKAGFPRFKGASRFDSFCFPQSGFKLQGDKLTLSKIGTMRIRLSREIEGKIKTCVIKREVDGWYVIFTAETEKELLPNTNQSIGIDVGLENFATLSNGEQIANPRFLRESEKSLKKSQRAVSRKKKGSQSRKKAVLKLRKKHLKIKRQRADFLHKTANNMVTRFDEIAVESLPIRQMVKNHHLAKSISDASWGNFLQYLEYKVENAGRRVWKVDAKNTSQSCICGASVKKTLATRQHKCLKCGLVNHRDLVSAQVILKRAGQTRQDITYAVGQSVSLESPSITASV